MASNFRQRLQVAEMEDHMERLKISGHKEIKSDSLPRCQLRGRIHNSALAHPAVDSSVEQVRRLLEALPYVKNVEFPGDERIPDECADFIINSNVYAEHQQEKFANQLQIDWCDLVASARLHKQDLWLELVDCSRLSLDYLETPFHELCLSQLALGTFTSPEIYISHWSSPIQRQQGWRSFSEQKDDDKPPMSLHFDHDSGCLTINWHDQMTGNSWWMDLKLERLAERMILVTSMENETHMYIFLACQPKIFLKRPIIPQLQQYQNLYEQQQQQAAAEPRYSISRQVHFGSCGRDIIGNSNVIQLKIQWTKNVDDLLQRLQKEEFVIYYGKPKVETFVGRNEEANWPRFESFDTVYAWFCLRSRGFRVIDQLTEEFRKLVEEIKDPKALKHVLLGVARKFDENCVCGLRETFVEELQRIQKAPDVVKDELELEAHCVSIRLLVLTPTTVRGLPAEAVVGNRVVREFGADRFIRVVVRDDDLEQLNAGGGGIGAPVRMFTEFMSRDLVIGDRRYHFLGSSNSQLREHGFWMYCSDGKEGHTVDMIRRWMGDLSGERCVASYVSRLGQFFSAARKTVKVENWTLIDDVYINGYCFTDGVGKISPLLAKKVSKFLELECRPSAFQIRFAGCKGVLAVSPELEGEQIQIRKTMEKFSSEHRELEVVQHTVPRRLQLNRQVVMLMSGLGVPNEAFFKLQESELQRMAYMLIRQEPAADALSKFNFGVTADELVNSGIGLTTEPFMRSLLNVTYDHKLMQLMNCRIEISADNGRIMMGTVDETNSLKHGEVFVQYSKNIDKPHGDIVVHVGPVVIAKNPCLHPGDLRKFRAVDKPLLEHMVDCVVFPATGERPHPNEMSGSDLDGDMYFVCWEESLIPKEDNRKPMDYTAPQKKHKDGTICEADMIACFAEYVKGDRLGVIANAHLVHADAEEKGIFSHECIKLAKLHSDAVDFPKTGQAVIIDHDLRPHCYPPYMQKDDKPEYISHHVLAKLYDQCKALQLVRVAGCNFDATLQDDFVIEGYERFMDSASELKRIYSETVLDLMQTYGIQTEAEIWTGQVLAFTHKRRRVVKRDHVEVVQLIRSRVQFLKRTIKSRFYAEFGGQESCQRNTSVYAKASSLYCVSHDAPDCLGLPWIFIDLLIDIRRLKRGGVISAGGLISEKYDWHVDSIPCKLSRDIFELFRLCPNDEKLVDSRKCRQRLFVNLCNTVELHHVRLSIFGSCLTGFDHVSSSLDVFVNCDCAADCGECSQHVQQATDLLAQRFANSQQRDFNPTTSVGNGINKPMQLFVPDDHSGRTIRLILYSNKVCLMRTAFIISFLKKNDWSVAVLRTLVAWGRRKKFVGADRYSLMTYEQLILLFGSFMQSSYEKCAKVDGGDTDRVANLLLQNHFSACRVQDCKHVGGLSSGLGELVHERRDPSELAAVLLLFMQYHASFVADGLRNCRDPSGITDKIFDLTEPQYLLASELLMQAYHLLACSGDIGRLLFAEESTASRHVVIKLPRQAASCIYWCQSSKEEKWKSLSGAEYVKIRNKSYHHALAGLVVDVWGTSSALLKIRDELAELEKLSLQFTRSSAPIERQTVNESYVTLVRGCSAKTSTVRLERYMGPVQVRHNRRRQNAYIPRALNPDTNERYSAERFVKVVMKQVNYMRKLFRTDLHGEIRPVISYGTLYVVDNARGSNDMSEREFRKKLSYIAPPCNSTHVTSSTPSPGTPGGTSHRPYKSWNFENAFIPAGNQNITSGKLVDFLASRGFVQVDAYKKYLISVFLTLSGSFSGVQGVLELDENFHLEGIATPDMKWLCVNIVTQKDSGKELKDLPFDVRFKIQSRRVIPLSEMVQNKDDARLVENHEKLLLRDYLGNILGVHPDYKDRIKFVRYKDVVVHQIASNLQAPSTDRYLHGMRIRLSRSKEYSRPSRHGNYFEGVDERRTEVTIIPSMPVLGKDDKDDDKLIEFLQQTWTFSQNFGLMLL